MPTWLRTLGFAVPTFAVFTINTLTMVAAAFVAARIPAPRGERGLLA